VHVNEHAYSTLMCRVLDDVKLRYNESNVTMPATNSMATQRRQHFARPSSALLAVSPMDNSDNESDISSAVSVIAGPPRKVSRVCPLPHCAPIQRAAFFATSDGAGRSTPIVGLNETDRSMVGAMYFLTVKHIHTRVVESRTCHP
jgi:hypothetical protein